MDIVDLNEERFEEYLVCLEDWSDELREAGEHKRHWVESMADKGLRVKIALDERGRAGGMIQYLPIENSPMEGDGLYQILCIWVHGHREGRGNFQGHGMGTALLEAAEEDARALGATGMAAWGVRGPFWMRASWFVKHGYHKADVDGMAKLVWKPFVDGAQAPRLMREKKTPGRPEDRALVTAFVNGWCPAQNIICERAKRACEELDVEYRQVDTVAAEAREEWGISDAVFVDDKQLRSGPPPSYKKIKKTIARAKRRHGG